MSRALDRSSLRAIVSSGMAFSAASKQALLDRIPGLTIVDTLGASEAMITRSTVTRDDASMPTTFAAKGNVRVLTDDGRDVVPGSDEDGVLAVAGRLPLGYHHDPDATTRMFREVEGVRYTTRAIAPASSPTAASSSWDVVRRASTPAARRCTPKRWNRCCVAITRWWMQQWSACPIARWGEMVTALVELTSDAVLDTALDESLREHARAELAGYKVPKRFLAVAQLPRTVAGKPDYPRLRALAAGS